MSSVVLVVGTPCDDAHGQRLRAVAGAFERLSALAGAAGGSPRRPVELICALARAGRIAVGDNGPWMLWYVPAQATLAALADSTAPSWGARVDAKQRKVLRRMAGAVFRLPYTDGAGDLAVFITDWSPFVAACAVAVHADHEALADVTMRKRPFFSGRFVRHPLHGDLLPVWVADWVKPEFGTGGVVVNPAHSVADLAFAREVGLPVRFGLGATEPTANPATWLEPPVIKSGQTVRAGRYGGLDHAGAADAYLHDLREAGHAEEVTLASFGRVPLAMLTPADTGDLTWSPSRRAHGLTDTTEGVTVTVEPTSLLSAIATLLGAVSPSVVATADAVTDDLLWLRLLAADLGNARPPAAVVPVARVGAVKDVPPEWLNRTLVAAGRPDQVVSVRDHLAEQVTRVVAEHDTTIGRLTTADDERVAAKAATRTCEALITGDFATAFAGAATTAKALRRGSTAGRAESRAYLLTTHVLFGLPLPAGFRTDRLFDQKDT